IFASENHDPPGNETKILTRVKHFREPIDRALFVGSAHALDESADGVVMRVAHPIVDHCFRLNAFLRNLEGEMNHSFFVVAGIGDPGPTVAIRSLAGINDPGYNFSGGRQDSDLERVQTFPSIAIA